MDRDYSNADLLLSENNMVLAVKLAAPELIDRLGGEGKKATPFLFYTSPVLPRNILDLKSEGVVYGSLSELEQLFSYVALSSEPSYKVRKTSYDPLLARQQGLQSVRKKGESPKDKLAKENKGKYILGLNTGRDHHVPYSFGPKHDLDIITNEPVRTTDELETLLYEVLPDVRKKRAYEKLGPISKGLAKMKILKL